jgi:Fic family protein
MAGKIRTPDDVRVVDDTTGDVLYQPPLCQDLPARLDRLIKFANDSNTSGQWIHPIIRAFIVHFMLSYEHPFVDGNGRVARALFYWTALKYDYWLLEYVSISSVIAESAIRYGRTFLYVETDGSDLTYFLLYHSQVLSKALRRLSEYIVRKKAEVELFEKHLHDVAREGAFNHRQSFLLNEMARSRVSRITIEEQQKQHGVSYLTARSDLEYLNGLGLVKKVKLGRRSFYLAAPNLMRRMTAAAA